MRCLLWIVWGKLMVQRDAIIARLSIAWYSTQRCSEWMMQDTLDKSDLELPKGIPYLTPPLRSGVSGGSILDKNGHVIRSHSCIMMAFTIPDSKVHGANMGPIWVQEDTGGPHVGPMSLAIWDVMRTIHRQSLRSHLKMKKKKVLFWFGTAG